MQVINPQVRPADGEVYNVGYDTIYYEYDNPQMFTSSMSEGVWDKSLDYVFALGNGYIYEYQKEVNQNWFNATVERISHYFPGDNDEIRQKQLDFEKEMQYFSSGMTIPADKQYLRFNPNPYYVNGVNTDINMLKVGGNTLSRALTYFFTWHVASYNAARDGILALSTYSASAPVTDSGDTKYIPPFETAAAVGNNTIPLPQMVNANAITTYA